MDLQYYKNELDQIRWELEETDKIESMAIDDMLQRFEQFDMELIFLIKLAKEVKTDREISELDKKIIISDIKSVCKEYLFDIIDKDRIEKAFEEIGETLE